MLVNINKYIDFENLFLELFKEHEEILIEEQFQAKHFKQILDFKNHAYKEFELLLDECDYNSKEIVFCFSYKFNDANESCNQCSSVDYFIVYNTILDEFVSCDYEQG